MNYTAEDLLNEIEFARTSTRENSREVFKKQKSKKVNNSSRLAEANDEEHKGFGSAISLEAKPQEIMSLGQEAVDSSITPPASTSSREIAGITAQQVKTEKGIKVSLSIQTHTDVARGEFVSLTAELKRHGRLRELKRYPGDSAVFEEHYINTVNSLKELTPKQGRKVCCGRLHQRGKRAAWLADMMVVGHLDDTGTQLERIYLYYNLEEYEIEMNQPLSERQTAGYYCNGVYGTIATAQKVPTLKQAPRRTF